MYDMYDNDDVSVKYQLIPIDFLVQHLWLIATVS